MDFMKKNVKLIFIFLIAVMLSAAKPPDQKMKKSINDEVFANEVTHSFIQEVKKKWGFQCEHTGGSMPYDIESLSVGFAIYKNVTIDEARELEVMLIEEFLEVTNAHEKIRPFLREYPFPAARANISLSFYHKKCCRIFRRVSSTSNLAAVCSCSI